MNINELTGTQYGSEKKNVKLPSITHFDGNAMNNKIESLIYGKKAPILSHF